MANDLIDAFKNEPEILNNLNSLSIGVNKRTGERFFKATTFNGKTFIKKLSITGIKESSYIEIPSYETKEERNKIIEDLYSKNFPQSDIASMLDISQSTVSNILKNVSKK